jgi:RHS repeat-associated protein
VLSIFTYSYDNAGNRTGVAEASGDRVTWSYDAANQLLREQRSGTGAYDVTFSYDEAGNRLTKEEGGTTTTYSYDAANQLSVESAPGGLTTYTYDANGNTQVINAAGDLTTHSWDIENRMTKAELPAGTINTISYDGDGKRRSLEDSVMLRNFLWDGENISYQTGGDDSVNRNYTYKPSMYGELVSESGEFHHYDALGSTDRLTDATQAAVVSYLYRAFGEQTILSGSSANRFGWVGKLGYYRQPDTADYWLRARVHRPQIGRFISRDPVRKANLYLYAGNSPVLLVDPSGRQIPWPKTRCQNFASSGFCCVAPKPDWLTGLWSAVATCSCQLGGRCRVDYYSTPCGAGQSKPLATVKGTCVRPTLQQRCTGGCEPAEVDKCGPDVTAALNLSLANLRSLFLNSFSWTQRLWYCTSGLVHWDFGELRDGGGPSMSDCPTPGGCCVGTGLCPARSVRLGGLSCVC